MKNKSNLDEMQEQKLLHIEHNGFWIGFFGLTAAILVQSVMGGGVQNAIGETIVLLCMAVYMLAACIRNGIWDRKLKADFKTNLMASVIASIIFAAIFAIKSYLDYQKLAGSIATFIFMFVEMLIVIMLLMTAMSNIYKKRYNKMENEQEEPKMDKEI